MKRRHALGAALGGLVAHLSGRVARADRLPADTGPTAWTVSREWVAGLADGQRSMRVVLDPDGTPAFLPGPTRLEEAVELDRSPRPIRTEPIGGPPRPGQPTVLMHTWRAEDEPRRTCTRCERCGAGPDRDGLVTCFRRVDHPDDPKFGSPS